MNYEHPNLPQTPKQEALGEVHAIPKAQPQELVSSAIEASTDNVQKLASVRERLGLSRREMLAGVLGVAAAGAGLPTESHAIERDSSTLERGDSYEDGIARLRELARTKHEEDLFIYVREHGSSGEWISISSSTRTISNGSEIGGATLASNDRQFSERVGNFAREGYTVEMVHTHPTPMLMEQLRLDVPSEGIGRVPPSPVDILGMFGTENTLSDEEKDRISFVAVAEEGRWTYESRENAPLARALEEGRESLALLSGPYARYSRSAARVVRNTLKEFGGDSIMHMAEPLLRSIERGTYPSYLRANLNDFALHAEFFRSAAVNEENPEGARLYFGAMVEAYDAIDGALRNTDPNGYGIREYSSTVPQLRDAESNFAPYVEFWNRRGVSLRYETFE